MAAFVLDAWAIMAWLKGQKPAAQKVRALLETAHQINELMMNIVNLGEVFYLSVKARDLEFGERVIGTLRSRIEIISASDDLVMAAASLKARHAISYADAFAAVTAILYNAPLVTGDPELRVLADEEETLQLAWIA